MDLVYYTIGFNPKYLDLLYLSILSLRKYYSQDLLVICDESIVTACSEKLKEFSNIMISPCEDSISAMDSSMKKLLIFDYDIEKYEKILFIDSDILVDTDVNNFFEKFVEDNTLYAFPEHREFEHHDRLCHSLMNYTYEQIQFFIINRIYVFNCGLFAFLNTETMKQHFQNIRDMIKKHEGEYYYEQSFMNVYFNTRNLVNTLVFNEKNCLMNIDLSKVNPNLSWMKISFKNRFVHFSYSRGSEKKLYDMLWWKSKFGI